MANLAPPSSSSPQALHHHLHHQLNPSLCSSHPSLRFGFLHLSFSHSVSATRPSGSSRRAFCNLLVHSCTAHFGGKDSWRRVASTTFTRLPQNVLFPLRIRSVVCGTGHCHSGGGAAAAVLAVVQDGSIVEPNENAIPALQQRSDQWHQLRKERLTASSFSSALGFWRDGRVELWEEKVGLRANFAGNPATEWGITNEAKAVQKYIDITGNVVKHLGFKIYKEEDDAQGWLGASPDGLIENDAFGSYDKAGVLEVKCPHNHGRPELGLPWFSVPYYYMPQIQGLLEILDRDWMDLYIWTLNGSVIFRIDRDPEYWILIFRVLSEFWWTNVVPAKQATLTGKNVDLCVFRPAGQHELTPYIIGQSKELAIKAKMIFKEITITENTK